MLQINDITYRIAGRTLLEEASVTIPDGHKVGLVGRNGTGKSTLLALIMGELALEGGSIRLPRNARIGAVAQEAPGGSTSLLDTVLAAGEERMALLEEAETATDPTRIADIQTRLADIGAHAAPARAAIILSGLGFSLEAQAGPCSALSGGWRMRVALAAALFSEPDVLLLDEPTNYLDMEGTIWLKEFIRKYPHTILMVSHDRDLLNESVGAILHLDKGKLMLYQGNYDTFERVRREKQSLNVKMKKKQDDARAHMQAFVDRFRYTASKARQAQSRLKALAKLEPIPDLVEDRVAPFFFPAPTRVMSPPLMRFEGAAAGYTEGKPVIRNITLRLEPDDRVALLGSNGNGKSTFAKLVNGKLKAMQGTVQHPGKLIIGYFAQHQHDELSQDRSPYDYFRELMPDATEAARRAKLGAYGFGATIANSATSTLSGGEKARLLFAIASFHAPHLLILDEPTNHLDIQSREMLIMAINEYEGAVLLISHDRHLVEACTNTLWLVSDGSVKPFDGDMADYSALVLSQRRAGGPAPQGEKSGENGSSAAAVRTERGPSATTARRKITDTETAIHGIEDKIRILDKALSDGTLFVREPVQAANFARLRKKLADDLQILENRWMKLSGDLEKQGLAR